MFCTHNLLRIIPCNRLINLKLEPKLSIFIVSDIIVYSYTYNMRRTNNILLFCSLNFSRYNIIYVTRVLLKITVHSAHHVIIEFICFDRYII